MYIGSALAGPSRILLWQHDPRDMADQTILGVVLEIGVPRGVDVLTAYTNRSARFVASDGTSVVWDRSGPSLDDEIGALIEAAGAIAAGATAMDAGELDEVRFAEARVLLLMAGEVRGLQGPMTVLSGNPAAAEVLRCGSALMRTLKGLKR